MSRLALSKQSCWLDPRQRDGFRLCCTRYVCSKMLYYSKVVIIVMMTLPPFAAVDLTSWMYGII